MTNNDILLICCCWKKFGRPVLSVLKPGLARGLGSLWWVSFGVLLVGLHLPTWAGNLPLAKDKLTVALEPHADWLLDSQGKLTAEAVADPGQDHNFTPLSGPLSLGFTSAVAWVRVSVNSAETGPWLLEVSNPILEDVRMYERDSEGRLLRRQGTLSDRLNARELRYRKPVFKVQLVAGETSVFYLRLASRTALVTNLQLTTPDTALEESARESFVWGLVFGAYLLVMFFYSAFWVWTRERVHLYYMLYVGTNLGAAFMTGRWSDMLGLDMSANTHTLWLGIFICLSLWIAPVFSASFLTTYRVWPRATRYFLRACATVSLVCIGLVLAGFYGQGVMAIQMASMVLIVVTLAVASHLAWKGDPKAKLLLLAFSLFYMGVMWRYMRNIGLLEPTWWNESVYQVGAFVHMMVMSTGIFSSYNALRRKSENDQARADAQERQRQRQYEFLGMVSHEVRTPLTVISASADNLLLDASVSSTTRSRVDKIIRHTGKLQQLFDTYLDNERLLNGDKPITMSAVDLMALCAASAQDMHDAHGVSVSFETDACPSVWCNADLIRVAITNLLENARKHARETEGLRLYLRQLANCVELSVSDEGPGIEDDDLPFIFDAYYRGKGAYASKGSGLGLHLVKFIAEQHKGRAYAVKRHPRGMQFVIELPLGPANASPQASEITQSFSIT